MRASRIAASILWVAPAFLTNPAAATAQPDPQVVAPGRIEGPSPNGLGRWSVDYQRLAGGDPAITTSINEQIDTAANNAVRQISWDATKTLPWSFRGRGTITLGTITVSELYLGEYTTDLPNMPIHTVATRVLDRRSGAPITWDSLFTDKQAGLTLLGRQTESLLPTRYDLPPSWHYGGETQPLDINFAHWIPAPAGLALYFPERQFGPQLMTITVPWDRLHQFIRPEFAQITDQQP